MANIQEKAILILAGNLNFGHSYLITTVCKSGSDFCCLTCAQNQKTNNTIVDMKYDTKILVLYIVLILFFR